MHRTIEASIPSLKTEVIVKELLLHPEVIGLNVIHNVSLKPPGDAVVIHVLNRGADDVLRIISKQVAGLDFSIVTSEVASINDPKNQKQIDHDVDEAIWEEMETGLRHNGRLTANYLLLMSIGGIIAAVGFVSEMHDLVIAFVAASIIAPGLESLAKIPLGIVLMKKDVLWTGLKASVVGYSLLLFSAGLTFWLLQTFSDIMPDQFLKNKVTIGLMEIKFKDVVLSLVAASASIIMYLSYRTNVIAGPLIALILIPVTAAIGISLSLGEWNYALDLLIRLGLDIVLILITGILLIFMKQKLVHKRSPIR
jgi:hypothetical protein